MKKRVSVVVVGLFCLVGCKASKSLSAENPNASSGEAESTETSEKTESAEASEPATRINVTGNLVFSEGLWRDKTSFKPYTGGIYKLSKATDKEETVLWSGIVREGKRHGKWVKYLDNGDKYSETHYKNGEEHGKYTVWKFRKEYGLPDGKPALEGYYKNGKRTGTWLEWDKRWHCEKKEYERFNSKKSNYFEGALHGPELHFRVDNCELIVHTRFFVNGEPRLNKATLEALDRAVKRVREKVPRRTTVPPSTP